jgi:hypothetical protein
MTLLIQQCLQMDQDCSLLPTYVHKNTIVDYYQHYEFLTVDDDPDTIPEGTVNEGTVDGGTVDT